MSGEQGRGVGASVRRRWGSGLRTPLATGALAILAVAGSVGQAGSSVAAERASAPSGTVWLCRPGQAGDPCAADLNATEVTSGGSTQVEDATPAASTKFDCFYVYPTVSNAPADNTTLVVHSGEIGAAVAQASRFSQVCRVWAPMYRQRTATSEARGLGSDPAADRVAYDSLLSGWEDYIAHDNDGRPIVFIGHSQGAAMLIRLLHNVIDPDRALRARMVSAIIVGGNVQVPTGKDVGGSFRHIPTCTSASETGCVIAYSTFGAPPPGSALFGRPGQGVSLQSGQTASSGQQVACVNPADFSSGPAPLTPYFLSATSAVPGVNVTTPWVTYPGLYTAQCKSRGGATWLQVSSTSVKGDPRPTVSASLGPDWGYHLDDVNLALGNLVMDVARQEAAFRG
ncbi:MAG: DUF3089 domain-containing protein [Acidimicrobiales bacterium]